MGIRDIVMESDSQLFIYALMGSSDPPVVSANIIEGIRQNVYEFRRVLFSHVKRQDNCLAHILAQFTKNVVSYVTWIEENLHMAEPALAHDVSFLSFIQ